MAADILVIDDEADIRDLIAGILEDEGHQTRTAHDSESALNEIAERRPALIFLDIWMQGSQLDGLQLLNVIKQKHPNVPVVIISGHGNIETAVHAIKNGAYDYVEKPFKVDRLILVAQRALEASNLKKEVSELKQQVTDMPEIIGESNNINQLKSVIEKVAPTNSRAIIVGPPGAGKNMVAKIIHQKSERRNAPFVVVSAARTPEEQINKKIFGEEDQLMNNHKIGAVEEAHNGTLLIEEVGELPKDTQDRILNLLVDEKFQRVGGKNDVKVDVRVLSATSIDLSNKVKNGEFREDLVYRLAVVPIKVPALSERAEDIPKLIDAFQKQIERQTGIKQCNINDEAIEILKTQKWPGNVRQLRNNIERLMILNQNDDRQITAANMPPEITEISEQSARDEVMSMPLKEARNSFEKEYIEAQLIRFGGNIARTANFVGMERTALHRKIKSLGINASGG